MVFFVKSLTHLSCSLISLKSIFYKNVLIELADPKQLQKRPHSLAAAAAAAEQFQFLKLFRG